MSMKDTDKGLDEIRSEIEKFKYLAVKCGITEDSGSKEVNGATVAEYAAYNEYGTAKIPARPFVSGWADNKREDISQAIEKFFSLVSSGGLDADTAAESMGQFGQRGIQEYIMTGNFVPNSPSTIKKKGSNHPLVDSHNMHNSVRYEVTTN